MGDMKVTAIANWFGSNRMLGPEVGRLLRGCTWVGIPFMGGGAELSHIQARTVVANDLHRHVVNLARVAAHPRQGAALYRRLRRLAFHPMTLDYAQNWCAEFDGFLASGHVPGEEEMVTWAECYFVCSWMGRAGKSGIDDEFNGRPSVRWNASGGDSVVRYRSAVRSLVGWRRVLARFTFEHMDAFDFLARCEDSTGHGLYCDPPFAGPGRRYRHNAGSTDGEEWAWHARLRDALARFRKTRVVCRFYDHPLVRSLYQAPQWCWHGLRGRKQSNEAAPEVLLTSNMAAELFS